MIPFLIPFRHEGPIDYWVDRLVSDRHNWRYVGIERSIYEHELKREYDLCGEQLGKRSDAIHASDRGPSLS